MDSNAGIDCAVSVTGSWLVSSSAKDLAVSTCYRACFASSVKISQCHLETSLGRQREPTFDDLLEKRARTLNMRDPKDEIPRMRRDRRAISHSRFREEEEEEAYFAHRVKRF